MSAPGFNPYAAPVASKKGAAPNPSGEYQWGGPGAYSVPSPPDSSSPDYRTGGSQVLAAGGSPDGTKLPDDIRAGFREPPENDPNDRSYNARRFSDFFRRRSVVREIDGTDTTVQQQNIAAPRVPDWKEYPNTRPTQSMHPAGYLFFRPEHRPRPITEALSPNAETHVSLADHRRDYPIMVQRPQGGTGRMTFRPPVRPLDEALYTPIPAENASASFLGNRSYRHGG